MSPEVKAIYQYLLTQRYMAPHMDVKARVEQCLKYKTQEGRGWAKYVSKYIPSRYYKDPRVRIIKWTEK